MPKMKDVALFLQTQGGNLPHGDKPSRFQKSGRFILHRTRKKGVSKKVLET